MKYIDKIHLITFINNECNKITDYTLTTLTQSVTLQFLEIILIWFGVQNVWNFRAFY